MRDKAFLIPLLLMVVGFATVTITLSLNGLVGVYEADGFVAGEISSSKYLCSPNEDFTGEVHGYNEEDELVYSYIYGAGPGPVE